MAEIDNLSIFDLLPYDYGSDKSSVVGFTCGMSVPPVMMKRVVTRLIEQGVFDYKKGERHEN